MRSGPGWLGLVGVAALVVTGCGGSAGSPNPAAGRPSLRAIVIPSVLPTTALQAPHPSQSAGPPPPPVLLPLGSRSAQSSRLPVSSPSHTSPGGSTAQPDSTGLAAPGSYTYATSGSARTLLGSHPVSGSSRLVMDPVSGRRQHSSLTGPDGTTEQVLESRSDGLYLVELTISAPGFAEDFRPAQPVLFLPLPAAVSRSWGWQLTSTDGKYTVSGNFSITGQQSVSAGSESVPCVVVDSTLAVRGSGLSFTLHQTDWASTRYVLPVKEHAVADGTAFGTPYHSDVTRTLASTRPS